MTTRRTLRLGDREVTRIGLGTNRLTTTPEHVAFVGTAVEAGIGHIDTAHTYSGGQSEQAIGAALAGGDGQAVVATKGGYAPGTGRPHVLRDQIETSLRRLRTEVIDLYYLHRVDPETPLEESLGEIRQSVDRGEIRLVGLSEVGVEQIERARAVVPVTAVQNQYSVTERGWDPVVDHCERAGIVFVPFFPLRGVGGSALTRVAQRHGVTPRQVALAWLLQRSPTMLPIPGTLSVAHVRENLAALDIALTEDDLASLG